ncbi:MAG TPA: DUF359 domain-containing protein [Candidatus Aenigmarchaeota archaeon]|nr:DUF359 domain-containing protein [Candidatus Aenigmarchaeota archaeon]
MILKKECRKKLRKPLGKLIKSKKVLLEKIRNKNIITIGDKSTQTVLELKLKPKFAIVDYKIERKNINYNYNFHKKVKVDNKPNTISEKAIKKIKKYLKKKDILLEVNGEEDLLALPCILNSNIGDIVLYGQPDEGIIFIEITKNKKEEIKKLVKDCFKN